MYTHHQVQTTRNTSDPNMIDAAAVSKFDSPAWLMVANGKDRFGIEVVSNNLGNSELEYCDQAGKSDHVV